MQASSFIFLVLIAIWAAYLLQHWVRRREHLATARSVDRFSDAMRVLERRTPLPEFDLSAPRPRSYAVSPARPSRQEVPVKRAQFPRSDVPTGPVSEVRSTRVFHVLAGVSARRVRGLSLLAALSLVLVASTLAAFSVLPWWSILVVVGALVADVAWLRKVAKSERAQGRAPARSVESTERPESDLERVAGAASEPVGQAHADGVPEGAMPVESPVESPVGTDLSGWAPVPVPPPTYTLKAKAVEPEPEPEPEAEAQPESWAVPAVDTEPSAAPSSSLDGMVFDCDLDEIVERRSAAGA